MQGLIAQIGTEQTLPLSTVIARLLIAALLGAAIGFEREWRNRPAGLRTHILVCLAAAIVAILALEIVQQNDFGKESVRLDPLRLIEAVTGGVAFLAAGFIIFAQGKVHGLTTGAGMWLASTVGLAAGLGYFYIAVVATILALMVLLLMYRLEEKLGSNGKPDTLDPP